MFKSGFGSPTCNYWLGNELLHQVTTSGPYKLRFDVQALASGQWYWAEYSSVIVQSEATKYRLTVGAYSGNAGDSVTPVNKRKFTTFDSDNDVKDGRNCAVERGGGFWWRKCGACHVTASAGFRWKQLGEGDTRLQTSRGWIMCV